MERGEDGEAGMPGGYHGKVLLVDLSFHSYSSDGEESRW
jgi:hypothetical protein